MAPRGSAASCLAAVVVLGGCATAEPIDAWSVRANLHAGWSRIASGASSATDAEKTYLYGDQLDARDDLALSVSAGQGGGLEARLSRDDEVRATFERFHDFEGEHLLDRRVRFDGTTYEPGTVLASGLDWDRASLTFAHRFAALRDGPAPVDLLVRVGGERDEWTTRVSGLPPPGRDRFQIAGAPLAGLEARIGLTENVTLTVSADGGGLDHGDKRLVLADAAVELSWNVAGPLDVSAGCGFSSRHQTTRRGDGERTDVRLNEGILRFGFAVHF